jgi:hypothetical protein
MPHELNHRAQAFRFQVAAQGIDAFRDGERLFESASSEPLVGRRQRLRTLLVEGKKQGEIRPAAAALRPFLDLGSANRALH